ncbi:hypothetical protein SPI_00828 [Niveomyces insectorum RCEF 264]|uniref:Uncharacterized protein n=1 Tax=Niveomyces insectorum RCEF 264 TaxID=1081102 RepID=A0A168AEC7_9HYPO|nr:hypothetical protein SPI_00828 [Niveomyces insectorum RCEF 264]
MATSTPTPGVLMRLVQPREGVTVPASALTPPAPCPHVQATWTTVAQDGEKPTHNTIYFVSDIGPLVTKSEAASSGGGGDDLYAADVRAHADTLASVSWVVLAFVNGRVRDGPTSSVLTTSTPLVAPAPATGSVIVFNGGTPRPDKVDDYHAWYDQEHGAKLTHVPGWQTMRRYRLAKAYGDAEAASFYGMNAYDAENGLGGKEWQAGVTEWTLRIRSQAARPNLRRVWTMQSAA